MKRIALLVCLCIVVFGGVAARAAQQEAGTWSPPARPALKGGPLENGPAVVPVPLLTGPASRPHVNDPHWAANVRANTDATTYAQQEPAIAVNPLNHLNIVAAQKDERRAPAPATATKEVWIETSTDGGQTWPVNIAIPMPDNTLPQQSDAVVTFSDNNMVFVTIIGYNQGGGTAGESVLVARSTDGGLTWPTPAVNIDPGLGGSDKEWTAIDLNPASPFYHRLYVTWTNFAAGPQFVEKWSSDNGVTWNPQPGSNYTTVSFGSYDTGQFSMPVVLPNGNVIATWNPGGLLAVGKSTDGGQSFINPNTTAVSLTQVNAVPGSNWRLNTIPSTAASVSGTLVSVWADGRNGKDDIYTTHSTDGGTTWSAAIRVAHNAAGSSYQVEPWISVAPNGRFDVIWYDDRNNIATPNTFDIFASHSTDGGATWSGPDEQVTDASTNLNLGIPAGPGWNAAAGDYIGVASVNDAAYGAWTDTRSGTNEDIYTSRYTPPAVGTATPTPTGTLPTATRTSTATQTATTTQTATATATPNPCLVYAIAAITATIVPGTTDVGNHCDDCSTTIPLPFPVTLYNQTYTSASVSSNGQLNFGAPDSGFSNTCLPDAATTYTIFPYWDDQLTDAAGSGIFTATVGSNFYIEWRTTLFSGGTPENYEVVLTQGSPNFRVVYGAGITDSASETIGVQDAGLNPFTQYKCNTTGGPVTPGLALNFSVNCGTATATTTPPTSTATRTSTAGPTATFTATNPAGTATMTATQTAMPVNTGTATVMPSTGTATVLPSATTTVGPSATPCTVHFSDVTDPSAYYYTGVYYLACHGVISGYADGTFKPFNNTTRAQMTKIVTLAFNLALVTPPATGTFADVAPGNVFYQLIETAAARGIVSGYTCGGIDPQTGQSEPCDSGRRPYFRPSDFVTRGQLAKIVVIGAGFALRNPPTPTFTDVATSNVFYPFIETAVCHGIISGYSDNTFRPNNYAFRGQIAKIVYLAVTNSPQSCAP